jgi:CheY-like chemotaxis protein
MRRRVLIVDDDQALRDVLVAQLRERGLEVSAAGDGCEALEAAKAGGFDAVVTDVEMPKKSGIELLRELRGLQPGIGVILMTGALGRGAARAGREAGAVGCLAKPFRSQDLWAALEQAFDRRPH